MRHSASFIVQPQVHCSSRMNLSAASLRAPEIPCQSTPGSSVAVCHVPSARHRAPSRKKGATLRILTLLLSLNPVPRGSDQTSLLNRDPNARGCRSLPPASARRRFRSTPEQPQARQPSSRARTERQHRTLDDLPRQRHLIFVLCQRIRPGHCHFRRPRRQLRRDALARQQTLRLPPCPVFPTTCRAGFLASPKATSSVMFRARSLRTMLPACWG